MAHIFMFVPVLSLVLFLILPRSIAFALYLPIGLFSLTVAYKAMQAQRQPPALGQEAMIGEQAVAANGGKGRIRVRYRGEIWQAVATQSLNRGQKVVIKEIRGLTLWVSPLVEDKYQEGKRAVHPFG